MLRRQKNMIRKLRYFSVRIDQALGKFFRVASDETDALDLWKLGDILKQQGKIGDLTIPSNPTR